MARREFTESGIEPGACGPREAETRRWPRHREAVATRRTRYSSVRCVYLILCLDVCPLAHQRLDDRQVTLSACHMQRCPPQLPPPSRKESRYRENVCVCVCVCVCVHSRSARPQSRVRASVCVCAHRCTSFSTSKFARMLISASTTAR